MSSDLARNSLLTMLHWCTLGFAIEKAHHLVNHLKENEESQVYSRKKVTHKDVSQVIVFHVSHDFFIVSRDF